ncbi:hypothetical protein ABPG72_015413 [Tetrahymena utriculariae]
MFQQQIQQNIAMQQQCKLPEIQIGQNQANLSEHLQKQLQNLNLHSRSIRFHISQFVKKIDADIFDMIKLNLKIFYNVQHLSLSFFVAHLQSSDIQNLMNCFLESFENIKEFTLKLNNSNLNKAKSDQILKRLKDFQKLEVINLECSEIAKTIPKSIAINLQQLKNLKKIQFQASNLPQPSSVEFFQELSMIITLKEIKLDFNYNCLSNEGMKVLGNMLVELKQLQNLYLSLKQCKLSCEGLQFLGKGISESKTLNSLYLDITRNNLESKFLYEFAIEIKKWNNLSELSLFLPYIGCYQNTVNAFFEGFESLKKMKQFKLIINSIDQTYFYNQTDQKDFLEMKRFSKFMKSFSNITQLDIQINSKCFVSILNQLKQCEFIEYFSFGIDLCEQSESILNYSKDQIARALQNLENIQKIKIIFYNSNANQISGMLQDLITSQIKYLHSTTNLSLDFQTQSRYFLGNQFMHMPLLLFFQSCLDSLSNLQNSLEHITLNCFNQFSNLQELNILNKIKNIKTLILLNVDLDNKFFQKCKKIKRLVIINNKYNNDQYFF